MALDEATYKARMILFFAWHGILQGWIDFNYKVTLAMGDRKQEAERTLG
jgi:hypothetical protein